MIPQSTGVLRLLGSIILFTALLAAAGSCAAPLPAGVKKMGVVITAEGGIEGTQVYRYDADGRPMDGTPAKAKPVGGAALPPSPSMASPAVGAPKAAPAPAAAPAFKTADGRTVPFALSPGQGAKSVDGAVDFDAGLRRAAKSSGLLGERFETGMAPVGKEQVYSRNNLLTLDTWHGRYDSIGRKKAEVEVTDTLDAPVRAKDMIEVKSIDRSNASLDGTKAEIGRWEERMGVEANTRYAGVRSAWEGRLNQGPKTVDQLSMQDINRYQFRRNRSDEPGLPTVKPGSDAVKTTGGTK
ncbi:MAG: hypothetical protein ACKOBS_00700 [Verrucomicrobiota bacterium]